MRIRRVTPAVLALLGAAILAGCWGPTGTQTTDCTWTAQNASGQKAASETVVLVDNSSSYHRTGILAAKLLDSAVEASLAEFSTAGVRTASVGVFDSASSTVQWAVRDASIPPARGSEGRLQARDRQAASNCLHEAAGRLLTEPSTNNSSDVLGAMFAAREQLQKDSAHRRLVLFTDGLVNTGCADLRSSQNSRTLLAACRKNNGLPDLSGVELTISGVGAPAASGQALSTEQSNYLRNLWATLCRGTGASVSAAHEACLQDLGGSQTDSQQTTPVGAAEPTVVVQVPQYPAEGPVMNFVVPSDLLFGVNESTLNREAAAKLQGLVSQYADPVPASVTVVGHTDSRASMAYNQELSRRRAKSVQDLLSRAGFKNISAAAKGETQPLCRETVKGKQDLTCMARDRRVEIKFRMKVRS